MRPAVTTPKTMGGARGRNGPARAGLLMAAMAAMAPMAAQAIDVDPGDFVPAPEGTTAGMLYLQHAGRDRLYAQGRQAAGDPRLDSEIGIARLVHYTRIGGLTVGPQILLPFGRLDAGRDTRALGSASGAGDVILAAPVWLVDDAPSRTYLGIAPYLYLPVGSHERGRALNLGENRWKFDLQAGFVKGLTDRWYVDLTGDAMFHGRNDDAGASGATLEQRILYQGQAYLRYQFTQGANAFVGLSRTRGGRTRVDGADRNDGAQQRKISVGGSYFVRPTTQLLVAFGRDLGVENGFRERARINLRLLQVF